MHFISVLLPDPLRPTVPKNSPGAISQLTPCSASSRSKLGRRSGCRTRSLIVERCSCGIRNVLLTSRTLMAELLIAWSARIAVPRASPGGRCGRPWRLGRGALHLRGELLDPLDQLELQAGDALGLAHDAVAQGVGRRVARQRKRLAVHLPDHGREVGDRVE